MKTLEQAIEERTSTKRTKEKKLLEERAKEQKALEEEQGRIAVLAKQYYSEAYQTDFDALEFEVTGRGGCFELTIKVDGGVVCLENKIRSFEDVYKHGSEVVVWRAVQRPDGVYCDYENLIDALMYAMRIDWRDETRTESPDQ